MEKIVRFISKEINLIVGTLALVPSMALIVSGVANDDSILVSAGGLTALVSLGLILEHFAEPLRLGLLKLLSKEGEIQKVMPKEPVAFQAALPAVTINEEPKASDKALAISLQGLDFTESNTDMAYFRPRDQHGSNSDLGDLERMIVSMRPCIGRKLVLADFQGTVDHEQTLASVLQRGENHRAVVCKEILPAVDLVPHTSINFNSDVMVFKQFFDQATKEYAQILVFMNNDQKPLWKPLLDYINRPQASTVVIEDLFQEVHKS